MSVIIMCYYKSLYVVFLKKNSHGKSYSLFSQHVFGTTVMESFILQEPGALIL